MTPVFIPPTSQNFRGEKMKNYLPKLFEKTDRHIPPAIRKKIQAHRRRLERQYCPREATAIQAVFID